MVFCFLIIIHFVTQSFYEEEVCVTCLSLMRWSGLPHSLDEAMSYNAAVKMALLHHAILVFVHSFILLFIQAISIAPLQVRYYSEVLPTQHGYCVGVSRRSASGNCELRTCPRSLRGG